MADVQGFDWPLMGAMRQRKKPKVTSTQPLPRYLLLGAFDFISILIVPVLECSSTFSHINPQKNILFWLLLALVTVFLISSYGGYRHDMLSRPVRNAKLATACYLGTAVAMLSVALLMGHEQAVSQFWSTAELILTPMFLISARATLTLKTKRASKVSVEDGPVAICFDRPPGNLEKALAEQCISSAFSGVFYLSEPLEDVEQANIPTIKDIQALLDVIRSKKIQDVIFVYQPELELISGSARKALLSDLLAYPARIWLAFDLEPQLPHMLANRSGHYKLIPIVTDNLVNSLNPVKRIFDLFVSAALLTFSLPVLAVIAVLVRLSGPGPVIFRQIRTGAHGRQFTVLKFRTMSHVEGAPFTPATRSDPRVTRIGRLLRRSSLDELLQLINVFKGDMSLVGPRPHAPETQVQGISFEDAVKMYRLRYRVKPGMTGLAQIRGQRGETPRVEYLEQRISSDLEYIETWSVWLDIAILLRTFPLMIRPKNAC